MKMCPDCGFRNRAGMMYCDDCACNIVDVKDQKSDSVLETVETAPFVDELVGAATAKLESTSRSTHQTAIIFYVRGATKPFIIPPGKKVLIGRSAPENIQNPDIDLTPYRGIESGVSRTHAIIDNTNGIPTIMDVGSSNGVHINGTRLVRGAQQKITTGDHIYLGRLATFIQVKSVKKAQKPERQLA